MPYFAKRSLEPEWMDVETMDAATAAHVFGNLETINHLLGGIRPTLWHLKRASLRWAPGETIHILDWGTGGADVPRALILWARPRGFRLKITGLDYDSETVAYAQKACLTFPEIQILKCDMRDFSAEPNSYDYAISSLTLHHLPDQSIVDILQKSDRLAKRGIIMNDLHRSLRAWLWIWILSRLGGAHPMVQFDGPLSVRRAFTRDELGAYANQAGLSYLKAYSHFGHRLSLAGEKE